MKKSAVFIWIGISLIPASGWAQLPPPPPGVPLGLDWFYFIPALITLIFYFSNKKNKRI